MVMMIASTPSLNVSSRPLPISVLPEFGIRLTPALSGERG
jgi:hypothetical protein